MYGLLRIVALACSAEGSAGEHFALRRALPQIRAQGLYATPSQGIRMWPAEPRAPSVLVRSGREFNARGGCSLVRSDSAAGLVRFLPPSSRGLY